MFPGINEKGQSLVEVLVVGVVSAIMIIALVLIILSSLKNAQFAQNQTQATKLAQDTIDKIRIMRDNNANDTLTNTGTLTCSANLCCFVNLWNNTTGSNFYCGGTSKFCYYQLLGSGLDFLGNTDTVIVSQTNKPISGSVFSRQIKVSQPDPAISTDYVNVNVTITWSDSSGEHTSTLETIITKPNYDCI